MINHFSKMFIAKSPLYVLLFNFRFQDILCVLGKLRLKKTLTIEKRNWYLVGIDSTTVPINYVRNVSIDQHLFGADVHIKVYGSNISVYYISKKSIAKLKEIF